MDNDPTLFTDINCTSNVNSPTYFKDRDTCTFNAPTTPGPFKFSIDGDGGPNTEMIINVVSLSNNILTPSAPTLAPTPTTVALAPTTSTPTPTTVALAPTTSAPTPTTVALAPTTSAPALTNVLKLVGSPEIQFYNNNKEIVVYNNNYNKNSSRYSSTRVGGGLPEDGSAIGYRITGPGVPPNTYITGYRADVSNNGSLYWAFFIGLNNAIPSTSNTFYYSPPEPPSAPPSAPSSTKLSPKLVSSPSITIKQPPPNVLTILNSGDVQFYNDNKQIVVSNNNYTNNGNRNDTKYIGGGLPEDNSAVGYSVSGPGVPPGTVITSYRAGTSNPSSMYNVFFIDLNNAVSGDTFTYKPSEPSVVTLNGRVVFADYDITLTVQGLYNTYTIYPGGDTQFRSDLIKEISTDLKISPSRLSITSISQVNSTDLSILLDVNNTVPKTNAQENDFLSAKCVYDLFMSIIYNTTPPKCNSMLPAPFINVDTYRYVENEENIENFTEHLNILSSGSISLSAIAVNPSNPVSKPISPDSVFDYLFMYSYAIAMVGSILYSIVNVVNLNPAEIIVNKNILLMLNIYIGICGFVSLFYWYQMDIPFNVFFNENVIKPNIK